MASPLKKVKATDIYHVPETQSLFDAKSAAIDAARIKALGDAFGNLISLKSDIEISNNRSEVKARGFSEVRGEWVKDIHQPEQNIWFDQSLNTLVIETTVNGWAKEYASPSSDIICTLSRNDDEFDAAEANEFTDGDIMYLSFRSGRDGYLAAFLIDDNGGVHTLLPYTRDSRATTIKINRHHPYTFFSHRRATAELSAITDRYILRASRPEHNRICIVFSTNDFARSAAENFISSGRPQFQTFADFDRWLFEARSRDTQMSVFYKDISINKPSSL